jgi:hypothetical protein
VGCIVSSTFLLTYLCREREEFKRVMQWFSFSSTTSVYRNVCHMCVCVCVCRPELLQVK